MDFRLADFGNQNVRFWREAGIGAAAHRGHSFTGLFVSTPRICPALPTFLG
jgi:hypothetical protein